MKQSKKTSKKIAVKKVITKTMVLTLGELIHLRDLMSISLPPAMETTISQNLAQLESRMFAETSLWKKVVDLCKESDVSIESAAPNYTIAPVGLPELRVFPLESGDGMTEEEVDEEEDGEPDVEEV